MLGPEDSFRYVEGDGARTVSPFEDFVLVLIGDQVGFTFLDGVGAVLSRLIAKFDEGESVPLVLPNPDLIYPKASGFGIISGTVALIIETALRQRFPERRMWPLCTSASRSRDSSRKLSAAPAPATW